VNTSVQQKSLQKQIDYSKVNSKELSEEAQKCPLELFVVRRAPGEPLRLLLDM
jgi:hypothetical protein